MNLEAGAAFCHSLYYHRVVALMLLRFLLLFYAQNIDLCIHTQTADDGVQAYIFGRLYRQYAYTSKYIICMRLLGYQNLRARGILSVLLIIQQQ